MNLRIEIKTAFAAIMMSAGLLTAATNEKASMEMPAGGITDGVVEEVATAGRYTYVQVRQDDHLVWVAGPKVDIKVGDKVSVGAGMAMVDFTSKALKRKFERIYFVGAIGSGAGVAPHGMSPHGANPHGANPHGASPHGDGVPGMSPHGGGAVHGGAGMAASGSGHSQGPAVKIQPIVPPEGGVRIARLVDERKAFAGKSVTVRGKVTRAVLNVMKTNWYHLGDGSGKDGKADLTVMGDIALKKGDVVTLKGTVAIDRDLGYGYRYEILLEKVQLVGKPEATGPDAAGQPSE